MPGIDRFIYAILILLGAAVLSTVLLKVLKRATFLTKRTQTTLDDEVLHLVTRPVHIGFQVGGILLAVHYLFPDFSLGGYSFRDLAFVLITLWTAYILNRLIRGIVHWYEQQSGDDKDGPGHNGVFGFLETMISAVVWGFAILFALKWFGVDVTALFAGLGIAGLAIAFGLQSTFASIFSALSLAIDKPIRAGDFIALSDGTEGFVEDIGMRSTRIRTFSNNYVIVPNTKLADMTITNYFMPEQEIGVVIPVGVSYATDLEKAEKVTLKVAGAILKEYGGVKGFDPFVRYNAFGDSAITFNVILRTRQFADQYVLKHEFIKALKAAFDKEGIEIPFPQMDVHLEQPKKK